ncbi:MAG: N-acetylglucosamine-6-phosphate deacetylase [Jatrophihabitantaceae bacterium]
MTVLSGARLVTPDGVLDSGWLRVAGDTIAELGGGAPVRGSSELVELTGGWLIPGFIDLHVHGGGGHDVTDSIEAMAAAIEFHRRRGTTGTLVSLMAGDLDRMCAQLGWLVELASADRQLAGAHLEGPFLAHARCGAQNQAHLQLPDRQVLDKLIDAGQGLLRTMTIAPELPDALGLISYLAEAGVVAALGHTDASYDQALAGYAAGATLTTHLFNAMPPMRHRQPGAAIAALQSSAALEIINDGVHVHPAMVRLAAQHGADRLVLVTDAMSATGVGDGSYILGGLPVTVVEGQARSTETGGLAGSTLTMDEAFRRAVREVGLPIEVAVAASSTNPARVIGLADRCGSLLPGLAADLVLLDDDLRVQRVMVAGRWL